MSTSDSDRQLIFLVAGLVALTAAVLAGGYFWALPAAASAAARAVPQSWEEDFGASVADALAPDGKACDDTRTLAAINEIVERLTAGQSRYRYRVRVARNKLVNAAAAPGGHIIVFAGLLESSRSPNELAGVLAHEIEHVEQRHVTRGVFRQVGLRAAVSLLFGDLGMLASAAGTLGSLGFQRQDEASADREAIGRLTRGGFDPDGLARFFEQLQEQMRRSGDAEPPAFLSTHPATEDRIRAIRELSGDAKAAPRPLATASDWRTIRRACRVPGSSSSTSSSSDEEP